MKEYVNIVWPLCHTKSTQFDINERICQYCMAFVPQTIHPIGHIGQNTQALYGLCATKSPLEDVAKINTP
jgi:hypothetical protein